MPLSDADRKSYMLGFKIMGDFGASIAVPVIIFVLIGKWLQTKYGFAPFGVIGGFVLAATTSILSIRKKVKSYSQEYNSLEVPHSKPNTHE